MCSNVSIVSTRIIGVEVFVVDRKGNARLRPQSPRCRDAQGVAIERWMGYGSVALSDRNSGRGNGGGTENIRDERRRAPPGDTVREAIVALEIVGRWNCAR